MGWLPATTLLGRNGTGSTRIETVELTWIACMVREIGSGGLLYRYKR
jgi:hypothetical protein